MPNFFDRREFKNFVNAKDYLKLGLVTTHGASKPLDASRGQFLLSPNPWHNGLTIALRWLDAPPLNHFPLLKLRLRVAGRSVLVSGCNDATAVVTAEIQVPADGAAHEVAIPAVSGVTQLLLRTGTQGSGSPEVTFLSAQQFLCFDRLDLELVDVERPQFPNALGFTPPKAASQARARPDAARFRLLITHATFPYDPAQASREFTEARYSRPERFAALPPFETLAPADQRNVYHGALSCLDLEITSGHPTLSAVRCIDSVCKIQHAIEMDGRLILCMEDFLCVLPSHDHRLTGTESAVRSSYRIDDPWFAGLHTVVPAGPGHCLVSAAGPDAVLLVDLAARCVVKRWRLPESIYGKNYDLTPQMSVHDHYIQNEFQLGHVNSAVPDGEGGCWLTTLGQGDVGHFDAAGNYKILAHGFVTAQGLRRSNDGSYLYFTESAAGRLIRLGLDGKTRVIAQVNSVWLEGAVQLTDDLFAFLLGDRNEMVVCCVSSQTEFGRFNLAPRGAGPVLASVMAR